MFSEPEDGAGPAEALPPVPVTDTYKPEPCNGELDEKQRLQSDLSRLPDAPEPGDASVDPAAAALAMLQGMTRADGSQWREGQALRRGGLREAQVAVPRVQGAGLGSDAAAAAIALRPGQTMREVLVARDVDGRVRSHVGASERLVRPRRVEAGEEVVVLGGPHRGAYATVVRGPETPTGGAPRRDDRVRIQLQAGGTEVAARFGDVRLRTAADAGGRAWGGGGSPAPAGKRQRSSDPHQPPDAAAPPAPAPAGGAPPPPLQWCRFPGLCVRFIEQGAHYNQKMRVADVTSPHTVMLVTAEGAAVDGVVEAQVETVVPKQVGSVVMVVKGKRAGLRAKMVARNKQREEVTVVFDGSLTRRHEFSFFDICAVASEA